MILEFTTLNDNLNYIFTIWAAADTASRLKSVLSFVDQILLGEGTWRSFEESKALLQASLGMFIRYSLQVLVKRLSI